MNTMKTTKGIILAFILTLVFAGVVFLFAYIINQQ